MNRYDQLKITYNTRIFHREQGGSVPESVSEDINIDNTAGDCGKEFVVEGSEKEKKEEKLNFRDDCQRKNCRERRGGGDGVGAGHTEGPGGKERGNREDGRNWKKRDYKQ